MIIVEYIAVCICAGETQWSSYPLKEYMRIDLQLSEDGEGKNDTIMSETSGLNQVAGRYTSFFLKVELDCTLPSPSLWFYFSPGNDAQNRSNLFSLNHIHPPLHSLAVRR